MPVGSSAATGTAPPSGFMSKIATWFAAQKGNFIGGSTFPWLGLLTIFLIAIVVFVVWIMYKETYETPENVKYILKLDARKPVLDKILDAETNRYGLVKYLDPCNNTSGEEATRCKEDDLSGGTTEPYTSTLLSNFYFSTAYMAGCFFPTGAATPTQSEYIFSPEAIQYACKGGARAFVFEIWPSMRPGEAFRPILQVVEENSNWRRISMNTMNFALALQTLVNEIYSANIGNTNRQTNKDVTLVYLRFRGVPKTETYKGVAEAIQKYATPYLLDPSFSSCRYPTRILATSIGELQGKIIFIANMTRQNLETSAQSLFPYINICQDFTLEYTLSELADINTNTAPGQTRDPKLGYITQTITFVIPSPAEAISNKWDWRTAHQKGIHCIPMNFFERANGSPYFDFFSRYSYRRKNSALWISAKVLEEAAQIKNPGLGDARLPEQTPLTTGTAS